MWIRTTDGDLVNTDWIARIGRRGGDGAVMLYGMDLNGLLGIGTIDEPMWQWLQAEWEPTSLHEPPTRARKKP